MIIQRKKQYFEMIDKIVFLAFCAGIFAFSLWHWTLDVIYKYNYPKNGGIVDLKWIFVLGIIFSVYFIYRKGYVTLDFSFLLLCTGALLVAILDYHNENYSYVCYGWGLPIAYISGKLVIVGDDNLVKRKITILYITMAIGMFFSALFDFGKGWKTGWPIGFGEWQSFTVPGATQPRTTYVFGFVLIVSTICYAIFKYKYNRCMSILIFTACIIALYCSNYVQARTITVMFMLSIIMFFLFAIQNYYSNNTNIVRKKKLIIMFLITIILFLFAFILAIRVNCFGIREYYLSSYWQRNGGLINNLRWQWNIAMLKDLIRFPITDYPDEYKIFLHPHSMNLVYGCNYGLVVFIIFLLVKVLYLKDTFLLVINKGPYVDIKYLLVPGFVCINLYYLSEPNGGYYRYFWMAGLLISGMIRGCVEKNINTM